MSNNSLIIIIFMLIMPVTAHGFQIEEFKSGMLKDQVREVLSNGAWKFDEVQDFAADTLIAYDLPEKNTFRQFVFSFCNDKLVGFEQEMKPSLKNFIVIAGNYNKSLGQPFKTEVSNNVISIGEKSQLAMYWRKGSELVGLKYILLAPNEQLIAVYETPNTCWQIPR
jgi:hypothetical protein